MRRKKRKSVVQRRTEHAQRRALERYGLNLTNGDLDTIAGKIHKSEGTFLRQLSNTKTAWRVEWKGQFVIVGYSKKTKQIVTFLPLVPEAEQALIDSFITGVIKFSVDNFDTPKEASKFLEKHFGMEPLWKKIVRGESK